MILKARKPSTTADIPQVPVYRFSVAEYHRLLEAGVLPEGAPYELLEGWIVPKMTHGPDHDLALEFTLECITAVLPTGWRVRVQSSITTGDSEPEPDVAIVRSHGRKRLGRHPQPADLGLVVEIAVSSLEEDRTVKARLYARAAIPVYWIVNLKDGQVEVLSNPTGPHKKPAYRKSEIFGVDAAVPLVIDGKRVGTVAVRDLLP